MFVSFVFFFLLNLTHYIDATNMQYTQYIRQYAYRCTHLHKYEVVCNVEKCMLFIACCTNAILNDDDDHHHHNDVDTMTILTKTSM